jgi:hypothetical protein
VKIRIRLGDADRERYNCPEWMDFDPLTVRSNEAFAMQAGLTIEGTTIGFNSPNDWRTSLRDSTAAANIVLVWLALRRAGVGVPLGEVEYDFDGAQYEIAPDPVAPDEESGKGEESGPGTT